MSLNESYPTAKDSLVLAWVNAVCCILLSIFALVFIFNGRWGMAILEGVVASQSFWKCYISFEMYKKLSEKQPPI
jgi:hypothetical protein